MSDNHKECWTYDGSVRRFISCINLHKNKTKIVKYSGECLQCEYMIVLPDEFLEMRKEDLSKIQLGEKIEWGTI